MFDTPASGSGEPADNQASPAAAVTPAGTVTPVAAAASPAVPDVPVAPAAGLSPIADFAVLLAELPLGIPDAQLVDRVRELEDLKAAAAATQARATAAFDTSQRAAQADAGTAKEKQGEGLASQIALARRDSPARGSRHLGLAHALTREMPHTLAALTTGVLSEWRATLLVRETACLDTGNRARVDETLAADPTNLEGLGDKRLIAAAKKEAYRLDPHSVIRRAAKAASERTVTTRPAPDTMTYVTGLLPVADGVAVQAALERAADQLRATGDERGRGQIMADTLVHRVTAPTHQQDGKQDRTQDSNQGRKQDGKPAVAGGADIEIQLVMTDRALLAGDSHRPPRHTRTSTGAPAHHGNHHPHRTPLPIHRTTTTRNKHATTSGRFRRASTTSGTAEHSPDSIIRDGKTSATTHRTERNY
ncbi:13E12 repeat family protein [Arthrobacter pigmenti]